MAIITQNAFNTTTIFNEDFSNIFCLTSLLLALFNILFMIELILADNTADETSVVEPTNIELKNSLSFSSFPS